MRLPRLPRAIAAVLAMAAAAPAMAGQWPARDAAQILFFGNSLINYPMFPVEEFHTDHSPHGTATTCLLAAMVTYAAINGERPPAGFPVPEGIEPAIAPGCEPIADRIRAAMADDPR
ncbi:hypothetical protein KTN05_05995 [Paracoccus sp. Z118]|uniref:hypothetical protein n=1 Tax=Paracoccus sp. Z118 TaxID=2851017 RepID=UPI001C2C5511|nr:hypothetical protein [Paracoccus sp. Z118]MBV0891405.1 hypothetical protein [Paracoccus sp. Z118]